MFHCASGPVFFASRLGLVGTIFLYSGARVFRSVTYARIDNDDDDDDDDDAEGPRGPKLKRPAPPTS